MGRDFRAWEIAGVLHNKIFYAQIVKTDDLILWLGLTKAIHYP